MRTEAEIMAAAVDQRPFSNGTEGYAWMDNWCFRCVHDDEEAEKYCPILTVGYLGKTPAEWVEQDRGPSGLMTLGETYTCVEFDERREGDDEEEPPPPRWDPEMPGQSSIFEVFTDQFVEGLAELTPEEVAR